MDNVTAAVPEVTKRAPLTQEERNDLRKLVLMGKPLDLDQARAVVESLRGNAGAAAQASGEKKARKTGTSKKAGVSDEQLDAELGSLGL